MLGLFCDVKEVRVCDGRQLIMMTRVPRRRFVEIMMRSRTDFYWTLVLGICLNSFIHFGTSLSWSEAQLEHVQPFPSREFETFPGIVQSSWKLALNKTANSDKESVLTKSVCELILLTESRVESCWVMNDEGTRREASFVQRHSPSNPVHSDNADWIGSEDLGDKELAYVWTKLMDQKSLGFVQKVFQG